MIEQYLALGSRIDLYFPNHKLAIEIDEWTHWQRWKKKLRKKVKLKKNSWFWIC